MILDFVKVPSLILKHFESIAEVVLEGWSLHPRSGLYALIWELRYIVAEAAAVDAETWKTEPHISWK